MTTKFARKAGAYHAFVIALAVLVSHVASGNPGDIDPSFADRGFFTSTELPGSANSILAASDGTYFISGGYTIATRSWDFSDIRLHGVGFLGRLTTAGTFVALGPVRPGEVLTTVLQPDQKIVGITRTTTIRSWLDSAFRLQPDGAPDTGFGSGGWVDVAIGGVTFPSRPLFLPSPAIVLEPDGGFTVAKSRGIDLEVSRVRADGTSDGGFADGGTYVGQGLGPSRNSILRTSHGGYRVLTRERLEIGSRCRVLALTQSGAADPEFGSDGYADLETPVELSASCSNLIELPAGHLLVVGSVDGRALAVRLLPDGVVDPSFSSAAIAETASSVQEAVVDAKGSVVVVGPGPGDAPGLVAARLLNDGNLDPSFGNGGSTWVDVDGYVSARDLAMLADNALLVAGGADRPFVVRLLGDSGGDGTSVFGFARLQVEPVEEGLQAVIAVRRTGGRAGALSVSYRTSEATEWSARAIAGTDYTPVSGELRWGDGDVSDREILVPITADTGPGEEQETFLLQLEAPAGGARVGTATATINIQADGAPAGLFTIETAEEWGIGAWEPNGYVPIQVARTYYGAGAVSVTVTPDSATALAGEDFAADAVTVSWADGETGVKEIQVPINNDTEEESAEEFTVKLTNATAGAIGARSTALIRIDDDDSASQPEPPPPQVDPGTGGGGGQTGRLTIVLMLCSSILRRRVCWMMRICRLSLAVCGSSIAAVSWAAPTRWEPATGGNGHLYEAVGVGSPISWDTARARARALGPGWDLATITSADENAFVKSLFEGRAALIRDFTRCAEPDSCWYRIGPWIGGFNVTAERQFEWVTGEPVTFTHWGIRTIGPQGQQVAYLKRYFSPGTGFAWSDPNAFSRRSHMLRS